MSSPSVIRVLRVARHRLVTANLDAALAFYTGYLGMAVIDTVQQLGEGGAETVCRLGFCVGRAGERDDAQLELVPRPGWRVAAADDASVAPPGYWKIGVTLADVRRAAEQLRKRGIAVSEPAQFQDIGFLCHLRDPDGHCIELLQHRFEAHFQPQPVAATEPLLSEPTLAHITLRVRDIERSLAFYVETLGLHLVAQQEVASHGFSLSFLGTGDETPPTTDWRSSAHREWLWQRTRTLIELQHFHAQKPPYSVGPETGFVALGLEVDGPGGSRGELTDPDGYRVEWVSR